MLNGSTATSTPSKEGSTAVVVGLGAKVAGRLVGDAGIWVGAWVAGSWVSVGLGVCLVGEATVNDRSHARAMRMDRDRKKWIFFMVAFPFVLDHSPQE